MGLKQPGDSMFSPNYTGFWQELQKIQSVVVGKSAATTSDTAVQAALCKPHLDTADLVALLSPAAEKYLEALARRAQAETLRHFGRAMQLFTPLYLANYCTNRCVYCGFNARRDIVRRKLSLHEVEAEARVIAATGLRKILALTGDAPAVSGAEYLAECINVLSSHFSSVAIEVPSMSVEEYALQVAAGADSMTLFQETYNRERYASLHLSGPKKDFFFRLDAPERALMGGMRSVNLGPLLGIADWREDVVAVALHARWIMRRYPDAEVSISLPRMRPHTEGGEAAFRPDDVSDVNFVQIITALRCFLPQCGITLSTREPAWLRDRLIPLGVTRVSAGVSTAVGGHASQRQPADTVNEEKPQFAIADERSVAEMADALYRMGYQPVFADWLLPGDGAANLTGGVADALTCTAS